MPDIKLENLKRAETEILRLRTAQARDYARAFLFHCKVDGSLTPDWKKFGIPDFQAHALENLIHDIIWPPRPAWKFPTMLIVSSIIGFTLFYVLVRLLAATVP